MTAKASFTEAGLSRAVKVIQKAGYMPEVILEGGGAIVRPMAAKAPAKPTAGDAKPREWGDE